MCNDDRGFRFTKRPEAAEEVEFRDEKITDSTE